MEIVGFSHTHAVNNISVNSTNQSQSLHLKLPCHCRHSLTFTCLGNIVNGQTKAQFSKAGYEHSSHSATHGATIVIDVKGGIKLCFGANTSLLLCSTVCLTSYSVFIETPPKQSGMAGTDGSSNPGKLSLNLSE